MNNHQAWRLLIIILLASLTGCATRQETIQSLAQNDAEWRALQQFAADYPDMADRESMQMFLGGFRQSQLRRQALAIEFRHKYPRASPEELETLVEGRMASEGPPRQSIDCTSMQFGNMVNTSCY